MAEKSLNGIHAEIQQQFREAGSEEKAESVRRFFKESIDTYGVSATLAKSMASEFARKYSSLSKKDWFDLCDLLWTSGKHEEGLMASHLSLRQKKHFDESDFARFEEWITTCISNWAQCDTFCNHTIGTFLEKYPAYSKKVVSWTRSGNRWVQRAAAVSLIVPAAKGLFVKESEEIVTRLSGSRDDMVQKGIGWLMKSMAEHDEEYVLSFLIAHKNLPKLSTRYASEKFSAANREKLRSTN